MVKWKKYVIVIAVSVFTLSVAAWILLKSACGADEDYWCDRCQRMYKGEYYQVCIESIDLTLCPACHLALEAGEWSLTEK